MTDASFSIRGIRRAAPPPHPLVLLTGATGTLGHEILRCLLADPEVRVAAVVRPGPRRPAREEGLRRYLEASGAATALGRVDLVPGDVARPDLGLAPADRRRLLARVTAVVHAAALTRLDARYDDARRENVRGTLHVARFGRSAARCARVVHVSSAYVATTAVGRAPSEGGAEALNAYERTKREAEAAARGLLEPGRLAVVRPSILLGRSTDGWLARRPAIASVLQRLGVALAPVVPGDPDAPLALVPADHAAQAVVRLLRAEEVDARPSLVTASAPVGAADLVAWARRAWTAAEPARFVPWEGNDPPGLADPVLAYVRTPRAVDPRGTVDVASLGLTPPAPSSFLPAALRFLRETGGMRRLPWLTQPVGSAS